MSNPITISTSDEIFRAFAKEVADNMSTSAIAQDIDTSNVAEDIDLTSLAMEVSRVGLDAYAIARNIDLSCVADFIDTDAVADAILYNEDLLNRIVEASTPDRASFDYTRVAETLEERLDYRKLAEEIVRVLGVFTNQERKQNA